MIVWTYWEGQRWEHIDVCLDTIARECHRVADHRHLTPQSLSQYLPPKYLHPNWETITDPALRCDCIRVALLARYGGLYLDADTILLRNPVAVIRQSSSCSYVRWSTLPDRVLNGYIYCAPGSLVAQRWLFSVNQQIALNNRTWTGLGERILTPIINTTPVASLQELPLATWLPIEIDTQIKLFFKTNRDWKSFVRPETVAFGLNHSWMVGRKRNEFMLLRDQWKNSPLLVHQLLASASESLQTGEPML